MTTPTLTDLRNQANWHKETLEKAARILATDDGLMATDDPTRDIALEYARQLGNTVEVVNLILNAKGDLNRKALDALNRPVAEAGRFLEDEELLRLIERAGGTLVEVPF